MLLISVCLPIETKWMTPTFDWFLPLTVTTRRIKTIWPCHTFGPDHKQTCANPKPRHGRDVSEHIINHDWLSERFHSLALHVVGYRGPLRAHKNSFGTLLGSPLLHLQLPVPYPVHEHARPLHAKALTRTPVRLHLVVPVAQDLLIRDIGPYKLKTHIERITSQLLSHVHHKSASSRDKLTLPRINLLTSERHNVPLLILGLS